MAGLPGKSAVVSVGPLLLVNGPSFGSSPTGSLLNHPLLPLVFPMRLWPKLMNVPDISLDDPDMVFPATSVLTKFALPEEFMMPAPGQSLNPALAFPEMEQFTTLKMPLSR